MKTFIACIFLLLNLNGFAQDIPMSDGKIVYEGIIESPERSKSELHTLAKRFGQNLFDVEMDDFTANFIQCNGSLYISVPSSSSKWDEFGENITGTKFFTVQFESKAGKCRIRIFNIHADYGPYSAVRKVKLEDSIFNLIKIANSSTGKNRVLKVSELNAATGAINDAFYGIIDEFRAFVGGNESQDNW